MTTRTASDLDKVIGQRLAAVRKGKGMTQGELGRLIGVTFQQVQKYETGANRIAVSTLTRLCSALDLNPAEFFPRVMNDGRAAPDPFAALGASIGGYELAQLYAAMPSTQRESLLSVAKAIASASVAAAARAA